MFNPYTFRCETKTYLIGDYLCDKVNPNFKRLLFNPNRSWFINEQSKLIESILLRISVGEFWFYEESNNLLICIDGHKRLQAIKSFTQDDFILQNLPILSHLNGFKFSSLDRHYSRRIEETYLSVNYIDSSTSKEYRTELITRLKT